MIAIRKPLAPECLRTRSTRYPVDRIVLHTAEGTAAGTCAWFARPGREVPTAAHFLIGRTGIRYQFAEVTAKLLHCGSRQAAGWNDRAIGIELEAWTGKATPPPSLPFPRDEFPPPMLAELALLLGELGRDLEISIDRAHVIGHGEIPGVTHTDPGPAFPWDRLFELLAAPR